MKIWYLAHPVREGQGWSVEGNKKHALELQEMLLDQGIVTIMPWFSYVSHFGGHKEGIMKTMFEMNIECVKRCDGIILTGHKLTSGMQVELDAALESVVPILNLIGLPGETLRAVAKMVADA